MPWNSWWTISSFIKTTVLSTHKMRRFYAYFALHISWKNVGNVLDFAWTCPAGIFQQHIYTMLKVIYLPTSPSSWIFQHPSTKQFATPDVHRAYRSKETVGVEHRSLRMKQSHEFDYYCDVNVHVHILLMCQYVYLHEC